MNFYMLYFSSSTYTAQKNLAEGGVVPEAAVLGAVDLAETFLDFCCGCQSLSALRYPEGRSVFFTFSERFFGGARFTGVGFLTSSSVEDWPRCTS